MTFGVGISTDSLDPAEAIGKGMQEVDGWTGVAALAVGFLVQAAGYFAIIGGHDIGVGARRVVGAATLAVAVMALGVGARWLVGWPLLRARLVHYSRWRWKGRNHKNPPDVAMLTIAADQLGKPWRAEETRAEYAARVFRLRSVDDPLGFDAPTTRRWIEALRAGEAKVAYDVEGEHGKHPWL